MPGFTQIFILKTFNAVGGLVDPLTRSYKFTGGLVVTSDGMHNVTVDGSGVGANAWDVSGNAGPGLLLGTTTADFWTFISGNLPRGGFEATGEFFLKTHTNFTGSEYFQKTSAIATTDATPTTLFTLPLVNPSNTQLKLKIQMRRDTGTDRAAFERQTMLFNEGLGAQIANVQTSFTEKTNVGYNVQIIPTGSNVLVQVIGIVGHNLFWSGNIEYQGIETNV